MELKLLHHTATLFDPYNYNLMSYLYQVGQIDPGGLQLVRRRFETVSVRLYIEVKR